MRSRRRLALLVPTLLSLALAFATPGAQASAASAYTTLGLTGLADFAPPSFTGGSLQDYVYTPLAPPADSYAWYVNPFGQNQASADFSLLGAVAPAPGAPTVPVTGAVRASADLNTGRFGMALQTQLVDVTKPGGAVSAFSAGNASAELGEAFDLLVPYAGGAPAPVHIRLELTLSGQVLDADNPATVGARATLRLVHVAEGVAGVLQQVQTYGAGLVSDVITLDATLVAPECSDTHAVCGYFFSFYAALESLGEVPIGSGLYSVVAAGDELLFDNGAGLRLWVPAGAVVTDASTGQSRQWVTAVPEPATTALWAAGLLGLVLRQRVARRRSLRT